MAQNIRDTKNTKICAGKGCSNQAIHPLTVIYLHKVGFFCESCKNGLISDGLVKDDEGSSAPNPNEGEDL